MSEKIVNTQAALQFGWDTLKNNFALFLKLIVILVVALSIPGYIVGKVTTSVPLLGMLLQFLDAIWAAILGMGVLKICLKFYDKQPVAIADLWSCLPL